MTELESGCFAQARLKRDTFARVDDIVTSDEAVLATNTSSLPINAPLRTSAVVATRGLRGLARPQVGRRLLSVRLNQRSTTWSKVAVQTPLKRRTITVGHPPGRDPQVGDRQVETPR